MIIYSSSILLTSLTALFFGSIFFRAIISFISEEASIPEDFAYYLLNDNDTLILVSASKNFFKNLKFSISNKHLSTAKSNGKLEFIVSSFAKNCGYRDLKTNFECNIYKPLISKNLITSFE